MASCTLLDMVRGHCYNRPLLAIGDIETTERIEAERRLWSMGGKIRGHSAEDPGPGG